MSIFNPYVLLGIVIAVLGSFTSGYYKGSNDELDRQQLEIAALNAEARQKEQVLVSAIQSQATKLQKANNEAKLQTQKLHSAIDSGAFKLRIPVKAANCPIPTATDTAPAAGDSGEARAELDRTTAEALISIAADGDAAIRKLNACIDTYEKMRSMK